MAEDSGFTLDELLADKPVSIKIKKERAEPKYRSPDDYSQTWSGNGRKPDWMNKLMSSTGKTQHDFKIKTENV